MPENVSTSRIYAQSGLGVAPASAAWFFVQNPTVTTFFLDSLSYTHIHGVCVYAQMGRKSVYMHKCVYSQIQMCILGILSQNQPKTIPERSESKGNGNRERKIAFGGACGALKKE